MPCNKQERPATKKNESQRAATTSNALIWIQMTTDAPSDMIRMQNSNQAKRCSPFPVGAAILLPERRIPGRTLLLCVWHHRSTPKSRGAASWTFRRVQPQRRRFFHVSENQGKIQGKSHVLLCLFHRCILGRSRLSDEFPHVGHQQWRSSCNHLGRVQFADLHLSWLAHEWLNEPIPSKR